VLVLRGQVIPSWLALFGLCSFAYVTCLAVERALPDYDQYIPKTKKVEVENKQRKWLEKVRNSAKQQKERRIGSRLRGNFANDRRLLRRASATAEHQSILSPSAGESP
jgi:hypothetical protein